VPDLVKNHKSFKFRLRLWFWGTGNPKIGDFLSRVFYCTVTSGWKSGSAQNICRKGEGESTNTQKNQLCRTSFPKTPSLNLLSPVRLDYTAFCMLFQSSWVTGWCLGKPDKAKQLRSTDFKAESGKWRCQERRTEERRQVPTSAKPSQDRRLQRI